MLCILHGDPEVILREVLSFDTVALVKVIKVMKTPQVLLNLLLLPLLSLRWCGCYMCTIVSLHEPAPNDTVGGEYPQPTKIFISGPLRVKQRFYIARHQGHRIGVCWGFALLNTVYLKHWRGGVFCYSEKSYCRSHPRLS